MGVGEKLADQSLGIGVLALAEMDVADDAGRINQILGRPVLVAVHVPGGVVVVDGDRIADPETAGLGPQAVIPTKPGAVPQLTRPVALELQLVSGTLPVPVRELSCRRTVAEPSTAFCRALV